MMQNFASNLIAQAVNKTIESLEAESETETEIEAEESKAESGFALSLLHECHQYSCEYLLV
jgi:hypothetical protein